MLMLDGMIFIWSQNQQEVSSYKAFGADADDDQKETWTLASVIRFAHPPR
jgi:hypothetical protein